MPEPNEFRISRRGRYPEDLKKEALRLLLCGQSIDQVSRTLTISRNVLHQWLQSGDNSKAELPTNAVPSSIPTDSQDVRAASKSYRLEHLRKQIKKTEQEREELTGAILSILLRKMGLTFFH